MQGTHTSKNNKQLLYAFIEQMPKVDLHVHLEGTIAPSTILQLAHRNNIALPYKTEKELRNYFQFHDFAHFVEIFTLISSCLKTEADFELIAYEFGKECARQHILYAEVTFSMETNCILTRLPWQTILAGLNKGRSRAETDYGVHWNWVFDIIRDNYATQNMTFDIVKQTRDQHVIALGLTGDESRIEPEHFIATFDQARDLGISRTIHAGELAGPESIWSAIEVLHAQRIGHGVRAIEDPSLIDELRTKQIPLEVCISSNICLGIFSDYQHHPIKQLWDTGLMITINDDDPALFNTDLNNEYKILVDRYGFDVSMLKQVALNGILASFLPNKEKERLTKHFQNDCTRLEKNLMQ